MFAVIYHPKIQTKRGLSIEKCVKKGVDEMLNSVDLDQTAPLGAVCSGSAVFAKACLMDSQQI